MSNNEWMQAVGLTVIVIGLIAIYLRLDRVFYSKHHRDQSVRR